MTFRKIKGLWSIWEDAYADWDDEKLELFGQYLLYLRELSNANTNAGAQSVLGVKNVKTFQRILKGQRVEVGTASKFDALILYFAKVADDGIEVADFETWLAGYQPAKPDDEEEDAGENQEDGRSTKSSWQRPSTLVAAFVGVALVGGGLAWYSGLGGYTEVSPVEGDLVVQDKIPPAQEDRTDSRIWGEVRLSAGVRYREEQLLLQRPEVSGISLPYEVFYQHNGGDFVSISETSVWARQLSLESPQELIFSIRDEDTGEEIVQVDRSDWLKEEVRKFLVHRARSLDIAEIMDDELKCDISGCSVWTTPTTLCSELVDDAFFVLGEERFPIRDLICEPHKRDGTRACIAAQSMGIPLKIENPPNLAVRFTGGRVEEVPVPLPVLSSLSGEFLTSGTFRRARAYDLPTLPSETTPGGFSAVATFQEDGVIQTHFRIIIGLDRCVPQQDRNNRILYLNVDGQGFFQANSAASATEELMLYAYAGRDAQLEAGAGNGRLQPWNLPADRVSEVTVAVGSLSQIDTVLGTFEFDPAAIAARALAESFQPVVACRGSSFAPSALNFLPRPLCVPANRLAMSSAKEVRFRENPEGLIRTLPIEFSFSDYLNDECDYVKGDCSPFVFAIPSNWETVQSQMVLTDGTVTPWLSQSFQ